MSCAHSHYTEDELTAMSIEVLDQMAFGCNDGQVISLAPEQLKILYPCDLENPQHRFRTEGKAWVESVDLSEPVEVSINTDGEYCLEDGHHRRFAAEMLGKGLRAVIQIKGNPVQAILNRQKSDQERERALRPAS